MAYFPLLTSESHTLYCHRECTDAAQSNGICEVVSDLRGAQWIPSYIWSDSGGNGTCRVVCGGGLGPADAGVVLA